MSDPPNILWICSDMLRYDASGAMGSAAWARVQLLPLLEAGALLAAVAQRRPLAVARPPCVAANASAVSCRLEPAAARRPRVVCLRSAANLAAIMPVPRIPQRNGGVIWWPLLVGWGVENANPPGERQEESRNKGKKTF